MAPLLLGVVGAPPRDGARPRRRSQLELAPPRFGHHLLRAVERRHTVPIHDPAGPFGSAVPPAHRRSDRRLDAADRRGPCHGPNLFVVNSDPASLPPQAVNYYPVDLACAPDDAAAGAAWFGDQFDRLAQTESTQNVLVQHFEHRAQDPAFTEQKVALLERVMAALHRTIVVVSALPPGRFTLATPATPTRRR